ncbi:MAG: hypothetical protein AMJ65_07940 [Phycisphaerae bacterium SG8_4]|nr:MAG: hypothetical protein AMJ65_07940 [Phycisphaerae bacterium SG8_4]
MNASKYSLGYCTNVHAGEDLDRYLASLERYAVGVKSRMPGDQEFPIGLWLSARTAHQILTEKRLAEFGAFLESNGLSAFTMNGFPYGNFHGETVKYQVYKPDWTRTERLDHTANLVRILTRLMPEGSQAGISTLPLGWPSRKFDYKKAADHLIRIAELLRVNELRTGKLIHLDIEPEPGCILSSSRDVVSFFKDYLLPGRLESDVLRYIRVCHDISHASVIFADQQAAINDYVTNGIRIGKVHISSAVEAEISAGNSQSVIDQLKTFQEDRYLHQTYIRRPDRIAAYDDLPLAIRDVDARTAGTLRCHFHVPIFIEKFGHLKTTRHEIVDCLKNIYTKSDCRHFEVETYAWTVLPDELKVKDLTQGIAGELLWVQEKLEKIAIPAKPINETIGLRT